MVEAQIWLILARLTILLFTGFIAWMTHRSYLLLKEFQPDFNVLLSLPESIARLVMVGICLMLAWLSGLPPAELGLVVTDLWGALALGLGIGLITQLVVNLVMLQAIKHFGRQLYSPWLIRNILPRRRKEWALIALAFLPSVAMEELLFRTLLLGVFQDIIPLWLLVIGSSVIFGLMHQPQGMLGVIGAGVINAFFSLVFIWSGQILVTLTAHYTVNILQVVVAYYRKDWLEEY